MSNNDEAGGSRVPVDPEEHPYFSMLAGEHFDAKHDEDGDAGNETSTSGAGDGNETTTIGAGDGNATSGSEAKRQRKERAKTSSAPSGKYLRRWTPLEVCLHCLFMLQKVTATTLDA